MITNLRSLFTKKAAGIYLGSAMTAAVTSLMVEQYDDARAINHPNRTVNIAGYITEEAADQFIAELLALNLSNPNDRINVHINSIGGNVYHGNRIIDAINNVDNPVYAVCERVSSMAFIIFTSAEFEKRYVQPDCTGMYHQSRIPIAYTDDEIQAGAPENDKFTIDELRRLWDIMEQNDSISYHEEYTGWERSITRDEAATYISTLESTNQEFSDAISAFSELTQSDIALFDGDDIYFTAEQMMWAGLADDYIGTANPLFMNIDKDRFCAEYDVSICPE